MNDKTLSEKIVKSHISAFEFLHVKDVRETIKKLNEEIEKLVYSGSEIYLPQVKLIHNRINKVFGEELTR